MVLPPCKNTAHFTSNILNGSFISFTPAANNWIFRNDNGLVFGGDVRLQLKDNLPFVAITVTHQGKTTKIKNVLVDTGSGGTILSADTLAHIGIVPQPDDALHTIFGV